MTKPVTIDGIEYVPKTEAQLIESKKGEQYCMVRTYSAGVFCGWIDPSKTKSQQNSIRKAKRIHYWEKASSLSELSMTGTASPKKCRVPEPVDIVYLERIIEVIPMTEKAIESINKIPVWKMNN